MTTGAELVRLGHNPSGLPSVDRINRSAAGLIDVIHEETCDARYRALAVTAAEQSATWAVKGANRPTLRAEKGVDAPEGGRGAELERQVRTLDEQLAACRRDRDAHAAAATRREQTIQELRIELDRRAPERPTR